MRNFLFIVNLILLTSLFNCGSKESTTNVSNEEDLLVESDEVVSGLCLWKEVSMRDSPSEKGKFITTVYRWEKLTFTGDTASEKINDRVNQYNRVKLTDGTEGWMRKDFLATNAIPAAFLATATIYKRPDIMTPTQKVFSVLDFVAITSASGSEWCEVKGKRLDDKWFSAGWVKCEHLTRNEKDVQLSILYARAMEIEDTGKQEEEFIRLLSMDEFKDSPLYKILSEGDPFGLDTGESNVPKVESDTTTVENTIN